MNFSIINFNNSFSINTFQESSSDKKCKIFEWYGEDFTKTENENYEKNFINKLIKLKNFIKNEDLNFFLIITSGDNILQDSFNEFSKNELSEKIIFLRHICELDLKGKISRNIELDYPIKKDLNNIFKCIFSGNLPNFFIPKKNLLKFIDKLEEKKIILYPGIFEFKNLISIYVLYKKHNFLISKKKYFYSKIFLNNKSLIISKKIFRPIEELIKNRYWSASLKSFQNFFDLDIADYYQNFFDAILAQEFKVGLKKNFKISRFDKIIINFMFSLYKLKKIYFLNFK